MQQPQENESKPVKIPDSYFCPITGQIMLSPVSDCFGHTFELTAIEEWYRTHETCPKTNEKVTSKILTPNLALKTLIEDFLAENPDCKKQQYVKDTLIDDLIKAIKDKNAEAVSLLINENVEKIAKIEVDAVLKIMSEAQKVGDQIESITICLLEIFRQNVIPFLQSCDSGGYTQFYMALRNASPLIIKNILCIFKENDPETGKQLLTARRNTDIPTPLVYINVKGRFRISPDRF